MTKKKTCRASAARKSPVKPRATASAAGRRERRQLDCAAFVSERGFAPCGHPDCDPKRPSCAVNSFHHKARLIALAAYVRGRLFERSLHR